MDYVDKIRGVVSKLRLGVDVDNSQIEEVVRNVYREGIKRGIWWFAVHKDGELKVGVRSMPIANVYAEVDQGKYD